jgi:isopentenyl diphosphate isomerase/L-lactate dehydrogenase-like FMN-dependent dehydrogenase
VRRGADVIKGLCLGAQMVGLGRALLYPLAAHGRPGVDDCIEILKAEMDGALALLGVPESGGLGRDLLTD